MLANQRDRDRTKATYIQGIFLDPRSYFSLAGHIYLRGRDRSNRRKEVFEASKGKCSECGKRCDEYQGDMHHIKGNTKHQRCDCLEQQLMDGTFHTNVAWIHGMEMKDSCHQKKDHRDLRFGPLWKRKSPSTTAG